MNLACTRLTPALGATATLPPGFGDVAEALGDQIRSAFVEAGTAVHPVIDHHPVSGRPYVNVSESFTRFVIGLSAPESARLLTYLFDMINRPDFHMRIRWQPETLVIWDNRGTQHYA